MAAPPTIRAGDAVLLRARVLAVHPGQNLVLVAIAEPAAFGGPGQRIDVLALSAVALRDPDPPDDPALLPPPPASPARVIAGGAGPVSRR